MDETTGGDMNSYSQPKITDYGTLLELTASNGQAEDEDGLGKVLHTDGTSTPAS
jgi:hypothetical protein